MADPGEDRFDQRGFAASAAALVASHAMSDAVWKTYFPELPAKQPELRTVLINIHRRALSSESLNLTDARQMIVQGFQVELGTAIKWLKCLEGLGFLVRRKGAKKTETLLVPSAEAKEGLFKVGQEYLVCLRLVFQQLRHAMTRGEVDIDDLEWLDDVKKVLETEVSDYPTHSCNINVL